MSANIFNKTFCIFNPYPESRKIIHSCLSALPLIVFFVALFVTIVIWGILENGLLLSLTLIIVGLNLILTDVASEIYKNINVFTKAIHDKSDVGVG
ncbi:MAG: hypothetical protein ACTSYR_01440, partial [Candidatus Odinarchaeia archaeon]